jgi:DNA-binding winged helix-turn-helix (wHTH) protein
VPVARTGGASVRYRFGPFVLAPRRRLLLEYGREVPLIPRYFDLLLLLVEQRSEAASRRLIFDRVWSDVVVSDGALSQAVRTLRRALGDDPREPRYIRTVARHGYRFVFEGVVEEEDRHEPGQESSSAPPVGTAAAGEGASLPLGRATGAAAGAGLAGLIGGLGGGLVLRWAGNWNVPATVTIALGLVGTVVGALGGAGVGFGLAFAEARRPRRRALVVAACGGLGGAAVGFVAHALGRWTIEGLFGRAIPEVGGAIEGLAIGVVVGLAYGLSARPPHGSGLDGPARARAALSTGVATAVACVAISLLGASLAGASLNTIARSFQGSQVGLAPLARLLGEPDIGPLTRAVLGAWEGLLFGAFVVLGFTHRR